MRRIVTLVHAGEPGRKLLLEAVGGSNLDRLAMIVGRLAAQAR
jgi:hypothetical protein